ncbi:MAG: hypothetical protein ACE5LX_01925 [Nitrospinota bacterium]
MVFLFLLASTFAYPSDERVRERVFLQGVPDGYLKEMKFVLENYTVKRGWEGFTFRSKKSILLFLLDRLPLAASMARSLKLSRYVVLKKGENSYYLDNQNGLTGNFKLIYNKDNIRIYWGEGEYNGWIIRGLEARGFTYIRYRENVQDGKTYVVNDFYSYFHVEESITAFLIRVVDTILRLLADREINQSIEAARVVSEMLAKEPQKLYEKIREDKFITQRDLEEFRKEFLSSESRLRLSKSSPKTGP